MDQETKLIIAGLCLVGLIAVFNLPLIGYLTRKPKPPSGPANPNLSNPLQRLRNPWEQEDQDLQKLSREIAQLHKTDPQSDQPDETRTGRP